MPTVVLLDKSLSMKRPVSSGEDPDTRLTLAKIGLSTIISYLENIFPLEHVSVMTFSSVCDVLVPFTKDHLELKECLDEITVADKTDLTSALKAMVDTTVRECGVFNPVQVILITDGILGIEPNPSPVCTPFPCQLHLALIATKDEFSQAQERLELLCKLTNTTPCSVYFPTGPVLSPDSVRQMFIQICQTHYLPFTSILKCGHLQSRISLSPSPSMVVSSQNISTNPQHIFKNPYTIADFPAEISICGFLDIGCLSAPGVYSKHFVIDADLDGSRMDKLLKLLLEDRIPEDVEKNPEADKPSFRVLLHGSLKCESKVAVVKLGPNWFGFLSSAAQSFKKSNLILTVLFPDAKLPWLGHLHYLGPKLPSSDPRKSDSSSRANKDSFPVSMPHILSYQSPPGYIHWSKESVLQADLTKVLRYSHKLPDKESSFIKELNKLRTVVFTYSLPNMIDLLCQMLSNEESSIANPQAKAIIQRSIHFLTSNHNPHEKLTPISSK